MPTIGERIKTRRKELKMSQQELALLLGYKSSTSIARIESGNRELPQKKIEKIAEALHTTPEYIMGWEKKPKKKEPVKIQFSEEARTNLYRLIDSLADKIKLDNSKIYEAIFKAMAELDGSDQDKVLNYANTLKENKSYREYIESIQKHKKR